MILTRNARRPAPWKGRGLSLALSTLALYGIASVAIAPAFLRWPNIHAILFTVAVTLPALIAMQALLLLGKFDLSVGAIASLAGMTGGLVLTSGGTIFLAFGCTIGIGLIAGSLNGFSVAKLRVDPLIATLAMMGIMRSLALASNDGRIVAGLPSAFAKLTSSHLWGLNLILPAAIGTVIVAELSFRRIALFRRFYAVGDNPAGADACGIRKNSLIVLGYVLAAMGAAVTGFVQSSRTLSASPNLFDSLALDAIAACILGGSTLRGGAGTMTGAVTGSVLVASTRNLVVLLGVPVYWKDLAIGVLLLLSVSLQGSWNDLVPRFLDLSRNGNKRRLS